MTRILLALFIGLVSSLVLPASAQEQEKRLALVIGNGAYEAGALQTAANDAGLVAQTLQAAGFDVIGARDLDGETLRKSFRDFVQKVQEAGPNTVAFVYLAGYGVQLTGENYFVPVDARIVRDTDVPVEGIRLSDYMRQLSALQLKANVIVLDAARANPFAKEGQPLAGGLALVEPDARMLVAFNAAPGTVAPEGAPPYGAYAQALAEMIRAGGLSLPEVFDRVRLRVSDMTKGAQLPWDAQKIDTSFVFFERQPDAPPVQLDAGLRDKPIRDFDARDAYAAALERDTLQGYEDFLQAFPNDPLGQARARNCRCAARGDRLAADLSHRYAAGLLVVPRSLSARSARRRCAAPSGHSLGGAGAAAVLCGDRVRRAAATARRNCLHRSPGALFRRSGVRLRAATTPAGLLPAAAGAGVRGAAATAAADRPIRAAGAGVRGDTGLCRPPVYVRPPPNNIIFANIHNRSVINNVINNRNPAPAQQFGGAARTGGQQVATPTPSVAPSLPPAAAQRANLVQPSPQPGGQRSTRCSARSWRQAGSADHGNAPAGRAGQCHRSTDQSRRSRRPRAGCPRCACAAGRQWTTAAKDCDRARHGDAAECQPNLRAQEPSHHQLPSR